MTRLEVYLTHPLVQTVGWALLHSLWQGALVVLLFAGGLVLARRRSPQLRYFLGCGALVLLIALPLGTGARLYESVQPLSASRSQIIFAAGTLSTPAEGDLADPSTQSSLPVSSALSSLSPLISPVTSLGAGAPGLLRGAAPWLTGVWLLGVTLLLLRLAGQALYVHRFRAHHQTPADAHWQARAHALAARLGVRRNWQLVGSGRAESPLTFGLLRPLIVLPTSALTGMPAAQLEALLAHELAHIKRHDYLINLFQCVVEALLFYHPAVWWVSSTVRRAREECCDDAAVAVCGDAKLYARALTNLEALRHRPALGLAATDKPLLARVKRLLGLGEVHHTPPLATGVLLLLMIAATAVLSFSPQPVAAHNVDEPGSQPGSLWVSVSSGVTFDDAYTRISELVTPAPYVLVEERTATQQRAVRVTRGKSNTDFVYTYTVDGKARPFDAQAQAWFDASLQAAALGPLKEDALSKARGTRRKNFQLVSHLDYDDAANRYISFLLAEDARLEPSSISTIETSLGERNLLSQVTHYAAHNLVSDSETGNYLKLFIERASVVQLEALTPDIMSTVAELEDEAVKADVVKALEMRLQIAEQRGRVAGQTSAAAPTASPTAPAAPKQGSLLKGVVVWNDERLANIKVELQAEPEENDSGVWNNPPVLQTTTTNAQGEYRFENVPPGNYTVWAIGDEEGYQTVGYGAAAYAETSGYDVLRLDKSIEVIGPKATVVTTLTPTLRWKPVPGAVRYEVGVDDFTPPEDPLTTRRYYRTDTPNFELTEPLERDRFYSWSVTAYTEDGTRIASNYEGPMFSTGRPRTLRPVKVRGVGVSTILPTDWQQTSPGVFENVNAQGEEVMLTFEKQPIADLEASLKADAKTLLGPLSQRHAGRDWTFITQEDNSIRLVTLQDNFAYFITTSGIKFEEPTPLAMEFFATVLPPMLQNFQIDEQPFSTFKLDGQPVSTFENGFYGVSIPHTLQDETDEP